MTTPNKHNTTRGLSLLVVLVVGSVMLFSAVGLGGYALRSLKSAQTDSDATRALYGAEDALGCVKWYIDQNTTTAFTGAGNIDCPGIPAAVPYTIDVAGPPTTVTDPFTLDIGNSQEVDVVVLRDTNSNFFDGTIRLRSNSETAGSGRNLERWQEYDYVRRVGADIMFVVDRSGSIDGARDHDPGSSDGEWADLATALVDSIQIIMSLVPGPSVGLVTFGSFPDDSGGADLETGVQAVPGECSANGLNAGLGECDQFNWREPDVKLTDVEADLITAGGGLVGSVNIGAAHTNLSLGLSIAGAELLGKYYPHGTPNAPEDMRSGAFEKIVHDYDPGSGEYDFDDLPDQTGNVPADRKDRDDDDYPDIIVVITDGEPNALQSHITDFFEYGTANAANTFITSGLTQQYATGSTKLFMTLADAGGGTFVAAEGASANRYSWCHDRNAANPADDPSSYLSTLVAPSDDYPYIAMCNAAIVADKLKTGADFPAGEDPILIAVVGVGVGALTEEFLEEYIASDDSSGDPLYALASTPSDITSAILDIVSRVDLLQSR